MSRVASHAAAAFVHPVWTSPPSTDYKLTLNVGRLVPSPFVGR
jgi:hypothetical protein